MDCNGIGARGHTLKSVCFFVNQRYQSASEWQVKKEKHIQINCYKSTLRFINEKKTPNETNFIIELKQNDYVNVTEIKFAFR